MINNVVLAGVLANKPLLRYIKKTSKPVLLFTIVVEREDSEIKDYIKCIFRTDGADKFISLAEEGGKVVIQGCLQNNDYVNKNGQEIKDYEIAVRHADLIRTELNYDGLIISKDVVDPDNDFMNYIYESD